MELVGRDPEQQMVAELVAGARSGRGGALVLVGEAGVGKSALLEYGTQQAGGMSVLRARGVQSEAHIPFAGLSELLRPALGLLGRIPAPQAAALEGALALTPTRSEERFAVGAATLSLLAAWAEPRPALVVVDDAHWIDGSSADALSFAFRRLPADPIAVLIAVRDDERSWAGSSDLPRLWLRGLDLSAASKLMTGAAGPVPEDVAQRVHRHSGGNPLAILEAAREIDRFRHGVPLDVPLPIVTRVSQVYVAQAKALPVAARTVLLLAAASDLSDVATLARAAPALGLDISALASAESGGLVDLCQGRVEFRHPLVRSAVYSDADPGLRRQVHMALANAMPGHDADRRAWHLALAALADGTACSALEEAASRARDRNAYDTAAHAFERSAQLALDEPGRARLLYAAADAAWSAGQAIRAKRLLDEASQHTAGDDVAISIGHLRGHIAARVGPVGEGLSVLAATAERAAPTDPTRAVVMLAEAVNAAFYAGDAKAMADTAIRMATVGADPLSRRVAFYQAMAEGMALTFAGEAGRGARLLHQAVDIADSTGDGAADDPRWLTWAAMGTLWLRESGAGRSLIERATDVARSRAAIGVLPYLLSHVAIDLAATDRWAEAEAIFHEVLGLARETHQWTDLAAALARLAWLEARQGKQQECQEHADEAIRLAGELGLGLCRMWALAALGDLCLVHGRTAEAVAHLEQQVTLLRAGGIGDVDISPVPELVELYLKMGAGETAGHLAAGYQDRAAAKGLPWALARAARCQGLVSREEDMDAPFNRALDAHGQTLDRFELARTHLAYGSRLRRARQRARARPHLRAAAEIFDALGARPWSALAGRELAATGETARPRRLSTALQLTPQELQIALQLAAKRTTRETAAALFLSPKTVEFHLRNVYRKLGCNTREELAAAMSAPRQS